MNYEQDLAFGKKSTKRIHSDTEAFYYVLTIISTIVLAFYFIYSYTPNERILSVLLIPAGLLTLREYLHSHYDYTEIKEDHRRN